MVERVSCVYGIILQYQFSVRTWALQWSGPPRQWSAQASALPGPRRRLLVVRAAAWWNPAVHWCEQSVRLWSQCQPCIFLAVPEVGRYRIIDSSCVAFLPGRLQSAEAAPDDGFAAAIVPVDSAEHFTAFASNDNLSKTVVAVVGALFAIGTGLDHSPAYQLLLHPQENVLRNNCFMRDLPTLLPGIIQQRHYQLMSMKQSMVLLNLKKKTSGIKSLSSK